MFYTSTKKEQTSKPISYHVVRIILTSPQLALLSDVVNGNDDGMTLATKIFWHDAKGRVNVQWTTAGKLRNLRKAACGLF